jgi:hypothetical protein
MTVDFRVDKPERVGAKDVGPPADIPVIRRRLKTATPPLFAVAQRPTARELAGLLRELFVEGTLSWEQLHTLANLPEFASLLDDLVDHASPLRKPMAAE